VSAVAAPAVSLTGQGFARLSAGEVRDWLGAALLEGWDRFAASWNDLDTDEYMADGGRYRRRRYACFTVTGTVITRQPHRPHYQGRGYNALNGGIDRWFTPVDPAVGVHPSLTALLARCSDTFAAAAGVSGDTASWLVEMHQFRIEADPRHAGLPTPEGMHRDGVDWVAVTLVGRTNVAGGVTAVADAAGRTLGAFTLETPLDTVLLDDQRVWHGVTPVQPMDPAAPAHRDVLVLTFRDQRR
jgi:hypothetical protein